MGAGMSDIEWAREQEEKREANQRREANLPDRDDADNPQDSDAMHISGPVPVADLSAANAVIDQERKKSRELEEKLAFVRMMLTDANAGWRCSLDECDKKSIECSRIDGHRILLAWAGAILFALLVFAVTSSRDRKVKIDRLVSHARKLEGQLWDLKGKISVPEKKHSRDY